MKTTKKNVSSSSKKIKNHSNIIAPKDNIDLESLNSVTSAKGDTHIEFPVEDIQGQIDIARSGVIEGWLWDVGKPGNQRIVAAMYNGRIISETKADVMRNDLKDAQIGDGRHGFYLNVPKRISGGGKLEIIDKETGGALIGSPVMIDNSEAIPPKEDQPLLMVDLSDMIFYLEHHDHLSGIQRVQANVFNAILEHALYPLNRLRVIYYKEEHQTFYEIPIEFIEQLIEDTRKEVEARHFKRWPDGRYHLEEQAQVKTFSLTEDDADNSVLLMLGAAWVFLSYFYAIRKLKRRGVKFVPLLHDLIPIVMPTMCDKGTAEVFKIFLQRVIRNADHVLTVSEYTRKDLISYCETQGIVCPTSSVSQNGQSLGVVSKRRELPPVQGEYVLFVSTIEGRKNHQMALQIWEALMKESGDDVPSLVFVGRLGWRVESLVEELHEKNFLNQKVVILSDISDGTLAALYENCLFTIYPSLYEGWGLPVGESLAFGKVCLASNATSIPEAGGKLVVYFDPKDLSGATNQARKLIDNHVWRKTLENKIKTKFRPILWHDTAKKIISGIIQASRKPAKPSAPLISVGEYSFSRISYLESNIVHGDEVTRHLLNFSEPHLTYRNLTLHHYIAAEECLADGIWFNPEDFGRWGHKDGNSLIFETTDSLKEYLAILEVHLPPTFLPAKIETSCMGRIVSTHRITEFKSILRLETIKFLVDGQIRISIQMKNPSTDHLEDEPRQLGVGISRLALIEANSIPQRLEIIERQLYA